MLPVAAREHRGIYSTSSCVDKHRHQRFRGAFEGANLATVKTLHLCAGNDAIEWQKVFCQEHDVFVHGTLSDLQMLARALRHAELRHLQ